MAIQGGITFNDRITDPVENPSAGTLFLYKISNELKIKLPDGTTQILSTGVTPEEVQDMIAAFLQSTNNILDISYNDALNILELTVIESNINHLNIQNVGTNTHAQIDSHISSTSNPHGVTKSQVGLGNVDNTSDLDKPVSNATQSALNLKENLITAGTISQYWRGDKTFQSLDKNAVGLSNVDNTSDLDKPISTATQTALNLKYDASNPSGFETPAQLNARDTANRSRANHTGTQLASTISDFFDNVRSTLLTGLSVGASAVIVATDTVLEAFGKLQAQHNNQETRISELEKFSFTRKTSAAQVSSSNTTLTNVTDLSFNAVNGSTYYFRYVLLYQTAANTTGIVVTVGTSSTAVGSIAATANTVVGGDGANALFSGVITTLGDLVTNTGVQALNTNYICTIEGIFTCTTSGTIVPQFRSEVAGINVTVQPNSISMVRVFS